MIRHLTPADYRAMPWANGRGQTVEMLRLDGPKGMLWRLSMAAVVEDGAFSVFPGIERVLTVISGPGFDLVGAGTLRAAPLVPIAFAGDAPMVAAGVLAPSHDFNVMTARDLPRPDVSVLRGGELAAGGTLCLFALGPVRAGGVAMARHDLLITEGAALVSGENPVIAVRLYA